VEKVSWSRIRDAQTPCNRSCRRCNVGFRKCSATLDYSSDQGYESSRRHNANPDANSRHADRLSRDRNEHPPLRLEPWGVAASCEIRRPRFSKPYEPRTSQSRSAKVFYVLKPKAKNGPPPSEANHRQPRISTRCMITYPCLGDAQQFSHAIQGEQWFLAVGFASAATASRRVVAVPKSYVF
jgi:hypothetical protein